MLFLLLAGRGYMALGDFTYFFVAGSDFVNPAETPAPVWVQNGQGYDGQFFYRYSLDPFDFSKTANGITVDLVPYRMQRILYPVLCWLASFGGTPWMVPYAMILINILAFFGILYFINAFIKKMPQATALGYLPLFLCGLYMSLGRDLSEVTELFFFTGALFFLFDKKYLLFSIFASLTLLTRETSLLALLPIVFFTVFGFYKDKSQFYKIAFLLIPFAVFAGWKLIIAAQTGTEPGASGTGNLGLPVSGIINGFIGNLDISTTKNKLQLLFWLGYFSWQLILTAFVIKTLLKSGHALKDHFFLALTGAWICWFLFALFLSPAVYIDDWSFVRVFSLWNLIGFLILIFRNRPLPALFRYYSMLLVALTLVRLIIRP